MRFFLWCGMRRAVDRLLSFRQSRSSWRTFEIDVVTLDRIEQSFDGGEFLRAESQLGVFVEQDVHLVVLPAEFAAHLKILLLDRNAEQRDDHDQQKSTSEPEKHEAAVHG